MIEFGKECTFTDSAGKVWKLSKITLPVIRGFRSYVESRVGDLYEGLDGLVSHLSKEDALALIKERNAIREQLRAFTLKCPLAQEHIRTEEGCAVLLGLFLSQNHPEANEDLAFQLMLDPAVQAQFPQEEPEGNLQPPA